MLSGAIHFTGRKVCGGGERKLTRRLHSDVCRSTNGEESSLGCEECIKDLACIVSPMCLLFTATRYVVHVCVSMFMCMHVLVACMCVCTCMHECACGGQRPPLLFLRKQSTYVLFFFFLFCPSLRKISHWPGILGICVCLPSTGIPHTNHYIWLFTRVLEVKLRYPCFHRKNFSESSPYIHRIDS